MKKHLLAVFCILIFKINSSGQSTLPEFGSFSQSETNLKECAFEKDAEAIVLFDDAVSNYDDDYQLITTRRIRIKILNQRGIDRGNITIPFYSAGKFEYITHIDGVTYTPNEAFSQLNKKSIYAEKLNDRYSNVKFAMPNVKAGSIIEYTYQSIMKHYGGLQDWVFQWDIPTLKSGYLLEIIPTAEFSYVVTKKANYPITINPIKDKGQIYFEMNNIPGLRFEPYMDAVKDYMQRVEFQLAGYSNAFGDKNTVNKTWKNISFDLATDEQLGASTRKSFPVPDDLKTIVEIQSTTAAKIKAIYNYVKNSFTWNGLDSKYAIDGLKKVWDKKSGNSGEINLVLVNLLQTFKLDACPMLVAERDFGKVYSEYPLIERFNKTVAYLIADNNTYILDATQKYCPFDLIPYPLLNTYALPLTKKNDKLIEIANTTTYDNKVSITIKLEETGNISGVAELTSINYAKEFYTEKIKTDEKKYVRSMEEASEGLKVEDFSYDHANTDSAGLKQHIKFSNQVNESGGFLLMNYNLFTGLSKNPFTADERFTNINFGYPFHVLVEETIEMPTGSKTDDLPKDMLLCTPDKEISISRKIVKTGNVLQVELDFKQSVTLVSMNAYSGIKAFYTRMADMLNEPIVIKVK